MIQRWHFCAAPLRVTCQRMAVFPTPIHPTAFDKNILLRNFISSLFSLHIFIDFLLSMSRTYALQLYSFSSHTAATEYKYLHSLWNGPGLYLRTYRWTLLEFVLTPKATQPQWLDCTPCHLWHSNLSKNFFDKFKQSNLNVPLHVWSYSMIDMLLLKNI